jgi:hypothetical protein
MSIDTLTIARRLEATKLTREQAEAIATAIRESDAAALAQLATKAQLDARHNELKGEIEALRKELKGEIDALRKELLGEIDALRKEFTSELRLLEQRMTVKLGTMLVGAVVLMAALVKLL